MIFKSVPLNYLSEELWKDLLSFGSDNRENRIFLCYFLS